MKFRLSLSKSIIIDLEATDPFDLGTGWAELALAYLREDDPAAQLDTASIDELTGALVQARDDDVQACISDLAIDATDFQIEVLDHPRVYTASKVFRAPMWRDLRSKYPKIEFTARWIETDISPMDDLDVDRCRDGWIKNIEDVSRSDFLVCYAHEGDPLSGTIVEVGAAIATGAMVCLIGHYDWKTWKHHPNVSIFPANSISGDAILRSVLDTIAEGRLP